MEIFKPNAHKMHMKGNIEGLIKMLKRKDINLRKDAVLNIRRLAMGGVYFSTKIIIKRNSEIQARACWALVSTLEEPIDTVETMMTMDALVDIYNSGKLPSKLIKPVKTIIANRLKSSNI